MPPPPYDDGFFLNFMQKQSGIDIMSQILKVLSTTAVLTMIKCNNKKVYTNADKTMCNWLSCLDRATSRIIHFTEKVTNSWNNQVNWSSYHSDDNRWASQAKL